MPANSDSPHSQAEKIYADAVSRLGESESLDIERLCIAFSHLAEELRGIHRLVSQVQGLVDRLRVSLSFSDRIRSKFGSEAAPCISLHEGEREPPDEFSSEVLLRLSERHGAFSRYRIEGEVARGGQGAVLRIWDEDLRRNLAMKVILGKGDCEESGDTPAVDSRTLGRFLEEAQVTGQLDHPGIVPVHELGLDADGHIYFTMKLVKGRTLQKIFDLVHKGEEGWTIPRALGVMHKVCEAMSYAHSKGVIHRDLKPANVMVGRFGEVYVMDWGLAHVLGEEDRKDIRIKPEMTTTSFQSDRRDRADETPDSPLITMDGDVMGTPAYMSPEQARGDLDELGARSDVYSVGAMLYHLLSGQMPYVPLGARLNAYAVWQRVQEGPPIPLRDLGGQSSPELEAICEKAMARDGSERYADIEKLGSDLRAFLEGHVVSALQGGVWVQLLKWVKRNRGWAATGSVALVMLFAVLGWALVERHRAGEEAERATGAAISERLAKEDALSKNYLAAVQAAEASLRARDGRLARSLLLAAPEELRGWEWRHLSLRADQSLAVYRGHEGVATTVDYSPAGDFLVSGGQDGTVRLWNSESNTLSQVLPGHAGTVLSVDWSPNGKYIASSGVDGIVRNWEASTGSLLWTFDVFPDEHGPDARDHEAVVRVAYAPSGDRIAVAGLQSWVVNDSARSKTDLFFLELNGATPRRIDLPQWREAPLLVTPQGLCFNRDGSKLAVGFDWGKGAVIDSRTGKRLSVLEFRTSFGHNSSVAWRPDDGAVALAVGTHADPGLVTLSVYGLMPRMIQLFDAVSGERIGFFDGADRAVSCLAFARSPTSTRLDREEQELLNRMGVLSDFEDDKDRELDSYRIYAGLGGGSIRKWNSMTGRPEADLYGHSDTVRCVVPSPDGNRIASASDDGTVRVWAAEESTWCTTLQGGISMASTLSFDRIGRRVARKSTWVTEVWDSVTATRIYNSMDGVGGACITPDGLWVILGTKVDDRWMIQVVNVDSAELEFELEGHEGYVGQLVAGPEGRTLVSTSADGTVRLWDLEQREQTGRFNGFDATGPPVFSRDGTLLAVARKSGSVHVFDVRTSEQLAELNNGLRASSIAFRKDGNQLWAGYKNGAVALWNLKRKEVLRFSSGAQAGRVTSLHESPDGSRLVSGGYDHSIRIWDPNSLRLVLTLRDHRAPIQCVRFSPDGERLWTVANDGVIRIYETSLPASR